MERKTVQKRKDWRGETSSRGLYIIAYDEPMSVREILEFGPSSPAARITLFTIVFAGLALLFSFYAYPILRVIQSLDFLFLFLGIIVLGGSFLLGKKFGRPFAIMLKWVGMPLLFLGIFGIFFARLGFGAFWVSPVDLYLGTTSQKLLAEDQGFGCFRALLEGLANIKAAFIKEGTDSSILMLLIRIYRELGATMNYYVVIPILVLISLAMFLGTVLLVLICGWITILFPIAACYGVSRLLCMLDARY